MPVADLKKDGTGKNGSLVSSTFFLTEFSMPYKISSNIKWGAFEHRTYKIGLKLIIYDDALDSVIHLLLFTKQQAKSDLKI